MNPLSDDFIKFIKSKDGQNELAYFHLDDLRVALLVQSLKMRKVNPIKLSIARLSKQTTQEMYSKKQ